MRRFSLQSIVTLSLLVFALFANTTTVNAQQFELYSANDVAVEVIPKIPGPNEKVRLKLNSYSFNLNNYFIVWSKDGERQSSGYGEREFSFTTGDSGEITDIIAVIQYEDQVFRKQLRFSPSQIDLLWEVSDGYSPPFYKGKVLPLKQSDIRITAIPETLLIEPSDAPNLVYYWDKNYQRQGSDSGFGRQYYDFSIDPLLKEEKITVTSNDRRENSFAKSTIDIDGSIVSPKVLFYEVNDDGRVLTQRALNYNNIINKDTVRLSFHPLNMSSTRENFTDLFVGWSINGEGRAPQDFGKQNELYISSGGQNGEISVGLELEGIQKLLQKSSTVFPLVFNTN
jgi:hypothetical protein